MEERTIKESFDLIEKELETLTQKVEALGACRREIEELQIDIKGLKLFLGRVHPEFKGQFPEIVKKVKD